MIVTLFDNYCLVTKETSDKRYSDSNWSNAESTFLYHVLQELKKQGHDLIKKRMYKDGHLVEDTQQYIRSRKANKNLVMIYNMDYSIYDAGLKFNEIDIGESLKLKLVKT
jgi:site-specific DNA-adenine methylase